MNTRPNQNMQTGQWPENIWYFKIWYSKIKMSKSGNFVIKIEYFNRKQKGALFNPSKMTSLAAAWSKTSKKSKKILKSRNIVTKLEKYSKI